MQENKIAIVNLKKMNQALLVVSIIMSIPLVGGIINNILGAGAIVILVLAFICSSKYNKLIAAIPEFVEQAPKLKNAYLLAIISSVLSLVSQLIALGILFLNVISVMPSEVVTISGIVLPMVLVASWVILIVATIFLSKDNQKITLYLFRS